jgi:hypothetical protein
MVIFRYYWNESLASMLGEDFSTQSNTDIDFDGYNVMIVCDDKNTSIAPSGSGSCPKTLAAND